VAAVAAEDLHQLAIERRAKVEQFQRKHRVGLLTLVFTDIVDSTKLKRTLGDRAAMPLILGHHAEIRDVLGQFSEGEEIETAGDSFLIVFTKPSDAVKFTLFVQARLRALAAETGAPIFDRIGIHVGEVGIMEREGAGKAKDLLGLQVDRCARVQSLGQADQILLTRFPFDAARQALRGEELRDFGTLSWLNHGPYLLKGIEEALEICEVGEHGKAKLMQPADTDKARRFVSADGEPVLGWRPAIDQAIPGSSWVLEKKLGEGGFGEVWLGRDKHLKTEHVFKFCFRSDRVRSLKREVALFRLLKERIGGHPHIVGIQQTYFDSAPFYIVMQHVLGESLPTWCDNQGFVGNVPLTQRLEVVAQIAEALQAAHDSGVIHRDVKPSNVLVSNPGAGRIHAYLTDFGIGQIISDEVRRQLSVSGFSQASLESASMSGTQLYMAPELFSGNPASIRSDIYALGVVLYQLIIGDLSRAVSTDWAKQIADPLLREDLEKCFAGDPNERFAGAGQLAEQLRHLEERREACEKQQALLKQRERAAYRRGILRTSALAIVVIAVVSALAAYAFFLRQEALRQRAEAQAQARLAEDRRIAAQNSEKQANDARDQADRLINFMLYDLRDKLEPIGRLDVLDDVAKKAKEYLDRLPKELVTASRLRQQATMLNNLGDVLVAQGKLPEALDAYQNGLAIAKRLAEQDKTNTGWQRSLSVSYERVGDVLVAQGKLQEALDAYQQSLKIRQTLAERDKSNTDWQLDLSVSYERVGNMLVAQGKLQEALDAYQQSLKIRQTLAEQDKSNTDWQLDLSVSYNKVGDVLVAQGKLQEALDAYQQSLKIRQTLAEQDKSNTDWQRDLSVSYNKLGDVLVAQGKLQEALDAYQQGLAIARRLAEQDKSNSGWQRDLSVSYEKVGNVLVAHGKLQEALDAYQQSLKIRQTLAEQDKTNIGSQWDLSLSYEKVGDVLAAKGDLADALNDYRDAFAISNMLASRAPSNVSWQNGAAWSRYCIAKVLMQIKGGDRNEAKRLIIEGLEIMRRLGQHGALNSNAQDTLNKLNEIGNALTSSSSP
jgi:serine/threonine-protein kinase